MFVLLGKQTVSRRLGWVADYCCICRTLCTHEVRGKFKRMHVYFVPLGQGELIEVRTICTACDVDAIADLGDFTRVSETRADVDTLIAETQPNIYERYAAHLAAVADGAGVDADTRFRLLREPFEQLELQLADRAYGMHADRYVAGWLLIMILAIVVILKLSHGEPPWIEIGYGYAAATVVLLGLYFTEPGRYVRRTLLPLLVLSLRPLHPQRYELAAVIASLRADGLDIGRRVRAQPLDDALQAAVGSDGDEWDESAE